jgi:hypothetical protein
VFSSEPAQQRPIEIDEVGVDRDLPADVPRAMLDDLATNLRRDIERTGLRAELQNMPRGVRAWVIILPSAILDILPIIPTIVARAIFRLAQCLRPSPMKSPTWMNASSGRCG